MNYSKLIFLFLISMVIFQTACVSQSRAEQTSAKNTVPTENLESPVNSEKQPPSTSIIKKQPTPEPALSKPANAVCGDPAKPCAHKTVEFGEWELTFQMPTRLVPNKTYSSAPFYAVIVKKFEDGCADLDVNPTAEPERSNLQKKFPSNKVFAEYSCPNLSAVSYDFVGKLDEAGEMFLYTDYIAVYAGETIEKAEKIRTELRAEFPKAEVKKMTANFGIIEQ